jgi:ubiquinone/menaquinone biosynthesis C-methylase UbiE
VSPVTDARYVPAAGRRGLTALYDPVMALTMREGAWRPELVAAVTAGLRDGGVIADVGAGTGTLTAQLMAARPDADVVAIDGDPEVLARAAFKGVRGREGLATALPVGNGKADRVVMSLLLHHLERDAKLEALGEARRVLAPGGRLHIADWGAPDLVTRPGFLGLQLLDGFAGTRDHAAGRLADLIAQAGFTAVTTDRRYRTPWGRLELISAG